MATKTTKDGREYRIEDGKFFVWTTDDTWEESFEVRIPLRIRTRIIRDLNDRDLDVGTMADMLDRIIPEQSDKFDDMDGLDFTAMFLTWREQYEALVGASLGE